MIYGCGVDIEELSRFTKHLDLKESPPSFIYDVFTKEEISLNKKSLKELKFPLGFSCKEAVFKAFGMSWTNSPISWKDIELLFPGDGLENYSIKLNGYAKEQFEKFGLDQIESSIDYNEEYVMFQVVLIRKEK